MEQDNMDESNSSQSSSYEIIVPPFKSRFPSKLNQFYSHPLTEQWMQKLFEFSEMDENEFEKVRSALLMVASLYPFADIKRFEILVKFTMLTFVIDDHHDKRGKVNGLTMWDQMIKVSDKLKNRDSTSMINWSVCVVYGYALKESMFEELNETQRKRFCNFLKDAYRYQIIESVVINEGLDKLSFDDAKLIRKMSTGSYPFIQIIVFADNLVLSDEEYMSPIFQEFLWRCVDVVSYTNDIYSFKKEYYEHNFNVKKILNVISLMVIKDKELDINGALRKAVKEVIKMERECEEYAKAIINTPNVSQDVITFVKHTLYLVGGNYYASANMTRYTEFD